MTTFRIKNLSVTLGDIAQQDAVQQLTPNLCLYPTIHGCFPNTCYHFISCLYPTRCNFLTPQTCLYPSGCPTPTPDYCWTPTDYCFTISPDTCGHISPVCDLSLTPTIVETIKTQTPIIATASEKEFEAVRADLEQVLDIAKERGVQFATPRSVEDVERLESELNAALKELEEMKRRFQ